jgi:hypothetical protein
LRRHACAPREFGVPEKSAPGVPHARRALQEIVAQADSEAVEALADAVAAAERQQLHDQPAP